MPPPHERRSASGQTLAKLLRLLFTVNDTGFLAVAALLFVAEALVSFLVVHKVNYTEIDWSTYMQQVECYLNGELNYTRIEGNTGPIVYPAGHLLVYRSLYAITREGKDIRRAQHIFIGLYLATITLVFRIFYKSRRIAPFVLFLACCTSYRIHSIFMLRLFNDPIAMMFFFLAVNLWISHQWLLGCIAYSFAVSIKMNILLFAPAVFFVLLANNGIRMTTVLLAICGFVQVLVAWPFLTSDPISYLKRAFELGRVFLFKWTVNWRFLPEELFVSKRFHLSLLALHFTALAVFAANMWFRSQGGLMNVLTKLSRNIRTRVSVHDVLYALFTANFIGIAFARSLHYQFYCWYYHSLHYLLFSTILKSSQQVDDAENKRHTEIAKIAPWRSIALRVAVLLAVEVCWNTYPSTTFSSALLHVCHAVILLLLVANREGPAVSPSRKLH